MSEKISIVIPTYNRVHTLKRAVDSVLNQTYSNIELLVVDDGSTDGTGDFITAWQDERIIYVPLQSNRGAAYARNIGVERATGSWIAFQDSDDSWRPEKLEKQMEYWREHPEYSMIYCPFFVHAKNISGQYPRMDMDCLEGEIFSALLLRNSIGTPTMFLKKSAFMDCGGFRIEYNSLEDWEFALRFSKKYAIGYLNEVLVDAYYEDDERLSARKGAYYEGRLKMITQYRDQLLEDSTFDEVVMEVFRKAQRDNLLEEVQKMMMTMLKNG